MPSLKLVVTKNADGSLKLTADEALPELDAGERFTAALTLSVEDSPGKVAADAMLADAAGKEQARQAAKGKKTIGKG